MAKIGSLSKVSIVAGGASYPVVQKAITRRMAMGRFAALVTCGLTGNDALAIPPTFAMVATAPRKITPEMFGAVGDGVACDTAAVLRWFEALGGPYVGRADGKYRMSAPASVSARSGLRVTGKGVFIADDSMPAAAGQYMLRLTGCPGFLIEGITLDGNRAARGGKEAYCHILIIGENNVGGTLRSVSTPNAPCDGVYIASSSPTQKSTHFSHFLIESHRADNCFRQGMSIIQGNNGIIRGGSFSNTNGTAPAAGVDLESNAGDVDAAIENILFDGVTFDGNNGYNLQISAKRRPRNIRAVNCRFLNNKQGAVSWGADGGEIVSPYISGFTEDAKRGAFDVPASVTNGEVLILNPRFDAVTATTKPLFYIHGSSAGGVRIQGLVVARCGTVAVFNAPRCIITGGTCSPAVPRAIFLNAADCEVSHMTISGATDRTIYTSPKALRFKIEGNR